MTVDVSRAVRDELVAAELVAAIAEHRLLADPVPPGAEPPGED